MVAVPPDSDDAKGVGAIHHGIERLLGWYHRVLESTDKLLNGALFLQRSLIRFPGLDVLDNFSVALRRAT
jgi:hypothetical protein